MEPNECRKNFALGFLGQLTVSGIPYALQRNPEQITAGTYKDIDLIAPCSSFDLLRNVLRSRTDVKNVRAVHAWSRSQLSVELFGLESEAVLIDIDYQITLIDCNSATHRASQLFARSICYSDLETCLIRHDSVEFVFLKPESELILLRNHVCRKPKDVYLRRINELERQGVVPLGLTGIYQRRDVNLFRRYSLFLRAIRIRFSNHVSS